MAGILSLSFTRSLSEWTVGGRSPNREKMPKCKKLELFEDVEADVKTKVYTALDSDT